MRYHQTRVYRHLMSLDPPIPREARGINEAFWKGYDGVSLNGGCLYPRGSLSAACWYAGRDYRRRDRGRANDLVPIDQPSEEGA